MSDYGYASIPVIKQYLKAAQVCGLDYLPLQRKLSEEGRQYKDALNALRLELALHYLHDLQNTELSMDNIARELGYGKTRSFYRCFKQWTGRTAGSYRTAS